MSFKILNFQFKSEILHTERTITLAIPNHHVNNIPTPIFLVFDGKQLMSDQTQHILQNYAGSQIFVGIAASNNLERFYDLTTYHNTEIKPLMEKYFPILKTQRHSYIGGNGKLFWQFICDELLPFLMKQYQFIISSYNLIGCSLGAYFCLQLLYLSKLRFDTCYILSPSVWFNQALLTDLAETQLNQIQNLKVNLWVGLKEPHWFEKTIPVDYYQDALAVKTVLSQHTNIKIDFQTSENGGHGYKWWIDAINAMLKKQ